MSFEHYIITRFNLPVFLPKVDGHLASSACDESYLDYRFMLFETYCIPSIKNQTCQDFKWLILMDYNTPDKFKKRLQQLHEEYKNLIPFYLDIKQYEAPYPQEYINLYNAYAPVAGIPDYEHIEDDPKRELQHIITPMFVRDCIMSLSKGSEYIITTRIDNDDSFHKDLVATVQDRVKAKPERIVLDYPYTYKFILNDKIAYRYTLKNNHFLSLVERSTDTLQSAIYWNHLFIDHFVKIEHIYTEPMQIELIHGNNVVNDFTELTIPGLVYAITHLKRSFFGYDNVPISYYRYLRIILFLLKEKVVDIVKNFGPYRKRYLTLPKRKREAVVVIDGSRTHGGLTDRFRNILSIYSYCKNNNIPFKLSYTYPCDLRQILVPNTYDWTIKNDQVTYNWLSYKEIEMDVLEQKNVNDVNSEHLQILDTEFMQNKQLQYHIFGNAFFAKGRYHELFNELFKPSEYLQCKIDEMISLFPEDYESVTLRFQCLLGDFREGNYPELLESEKARLIKKCIDKIDELYSDNYFKTEKILVTSDSRTFLNEVSKKPYVYTIPGKLEHMDYTSNSELETNAKSFVDLFMLTRAKRLTQLHTGQMYKSGFPEFAAELGGKEYQIINF